MILIYIGTSKRESSSKEQKISENLNSEITSENKYSYGFKYLVVENEKKVEV